MKYQKYVVNIGRLLSEQINSPHNCKDYLGDKSKVLFRLTLVNEDRIGCIIKKLKSKSSYGYDEISNNIIYLFIYLLNIIHSGTSSE